MAEEATKTPAKKSNTGLIVGIIIAAIAVIVGIIILVVCLNQPKTLEQYYKSDPEISAQVDETKSSLSTDGVTTDITFNGNAMKFTLTLSGDYAANSDLVVQYYDSKKSDIESGFQSMISAAKQEGINDVTVTMEIVSGGSVIWSYTVK